MSFVFLDAPPPNLPPPPKKKKKIRPARYIMIWPSKRRLL